MLDGLPCIKLSKYLFTGCRKRWVSSEKCNRIVLLIDSTLLPLILASKIDLNNLLSLLKNGRCLNEHDSTNVSTNSRFLLS